MSFPLISLISINYNQLQVTCEMLDSCKHLTYPNYEIIVVDNASKENPAAYLNDRYPDVKVIVSAENLGFAGGNNLGIAQAKGEYLFFLNNDTEVTPDIIERLLAPFQNDATIGMVSPKIYYHSHPKMIQYAGYTEVHPVTGRNATIGGYEMDYGQHDKGQYTSYAHGAAMMVSRQVVETVGEMPDVFFMYYEELDWCSQIRRAGYQIYYQPEAHIYHKDSVTVGKESPLKAYYYIRNRILFMRRNTDGVKLAAFLLYVSTVVAPKTILGHLLKFRTEHLKATFRGLAWNLTHRVAVR